MNDAACSVQSYLEVRRLSETLCAPLTIEDYVPQSMPEASPAKWHLAHTSWFFERFILQEHAAGYQCFDPGFDYLFNSYYQSVGPQVPRAARGLLSRPTVEQVRQYRSHVDEHMSELLQSERVGRAPLAALLQLGLNHEQQHQELLLTDLKHLLFCNPLHPPYRDPGARPATQRPSAAQSRSSGVAGASDPGPLQWQEFSAGMHSIGADPQAGFCFDNETPRHRRYLDAFALADRLVTNAEYCQFIHDGGYRQPALWLSDGWPLAQDWQHPLYWDQSLDSEFTLEGPAQLQPHYPVCHLSYYEADAFARWAGARLPTEQEWERAAADTPVSGNFLDSGRLQPLPAPQRPDPAQRSCDAGQSAPAPAPAPAAAPAPETARAAQVAQLYGDVWEWTASAYLSYPGFRPWPGALGEYNGKFMANQFVLRGGSCATPRSHMRPSYRNFFYPQSRWQFAGLRLAKDL